MQISIIGGGYVGLVTGSCLSTLGHDVTIIDIDASKIDAINKKISPIYEEGLEKILKEHVGVNLRASLTYDSISESEVIFIAVGTPPNPDGSANLSYIRSATENIANELRKRSVAYPIITIKSTVPPGTTKNLVQEILVNNLKIPFGCCMNPEFLREGRAVEDFLHPDRIVIGADDDKTAEIMKKVYENLQSRIISTGVTAAEMIKYTANSLLATKISFSNEIGNICKALGINTYEVMKGVGLDHRISPFFLNAGAGFGGSCFPKDVSALVSLAEKCDTNPIILKSVLEVNEQQPLRLITMLEKKLGNLAGKRVCVLGLAFKDNTDDVRESRSIPVIKTLMKKGANLVCYDPMASENMIRLFPGLQCVKSATEALAGADGCIVMTEWPEFSTLNKEFDGMKSRIIIDGRHILTIPDADGVCW